MRRSKYDIVADRLSARISAGDYQVGKFPSERVIAENVGVSHMTARKAVKKLLEEGHLVRLSNGRLDICNGKNGMQVALLAPAWETLEVSMWHVAISRLTRKYKFSLKLVYYFHPDDPAIQNTVRQFDATFFFTLDFGTDLPVELRKIGKPVFVLNNDWSRFGIPSVMSFPPRFVTGMLEHLLSIGHRKIDCLNVQPGMTVIPERIAEWEKWMQEHDVEGRLFNEPVESYSDPLSSAYTLVDRLIRTGKFKSKALFCLTMPAAFGAMRALMDNGIYPGEDVAVCSCDAGPRPEYSIPTLTSMQVIDISPFIETCLDWLTKKPRGKWQGPLLLEAESIGVVVRQSTVPDIDKKVTPARRRRREAV